MSCSLRSTSALRQHFSGFYTLTFRFNAKYNIYMAVGFVAFDWSARIIWVLLRNTHVLDQVRARAPGYTARLEALSGDMVRITIDEPAFIWRAGQHAYICIPRLGPFDLHPFTIANACHSAQDDQKRGLTMVVKAHSGFTKRLRKTVINWRSDSRTYRAFLSGPWGLPPDLRHYESVVMIACSSGASFIVPLMQDLVRRPACVRKATLHWIIRSEDHYAWYERDMLAMTDAADRGNMELRVVVHVTRSSQSVAAGGSQPYNKTFDGHMLFAADSNSEKKSSAGSVASLTSEKTPLSPFEVQAGLQPASALSTRYGGRPTVESMIRPVVEAAVGESAVVICGGVSISAQTRTFVAALSDERGVHKGSGAEGIFLFSETYGW